MAFDLTQPVPLLIVGDGPDQPTGLGRIGHDLAWLLSGMPEFRVGYLGRLSFGRSGYPWTQYSVGIQDQWGEHRIASAWQDLSQGRRGIVFTVWDASRLLWFAEPRDLDIGTGYEKWGYFMCDGAGIDPECLPLEQTCVLSKYDRVLLASQWAHQLALHTIEPKPAGRIDWLPHGINTGSFRPVDRDLARSLWGVDRRQTVVGCVMANQARKHWPVVFEAVARMKGKPYLWMHTDRLLNYWDLSALAVEFGMAERIFTDNRPLTDKELAMRYSGCDVTVVVSGGEGFCYPAAESLACGCPVVVGTYGAARELAGAGVSPAYFGIDTSHNVLRAYYGAASVAAAMEGALTWDREATRKRVEHLEWKKLSVQWRKWIRQGLTERSGQSLQQLP